MDELYSKALIIPMHLPGGGPLMVWHRATRSSRRLSIEDPKPGLADLPWRLKRTLAAKGDELHRLGIVKRATPQWLRAMLSLEDHLNMVGLADTRARPVEGFHYPCNWMTHRFPSSRHPDRATGAYAFEIAFEGTVPLPPFVTAQLFPGLFGRFPGIKGRIVEHSQSMNSEEIRGRVTIREDQAHMILEGAGWGLIDAETLRVVHCSTRKELIAKTSETITANSNEWKLLQPFIPLPYKIRLIGEAPRPAAKPQQVETQA